jgi:hypothetical protein
MAGLPDPNGGTLHPDLFFLKIARLHFGDSLSLVKANFLWPGSKGVGRKKIGGKRSPPGDPPRVSAE